MFSSEKLDVLQGKLGYKFSDPNYLKLALTHRSLNQNPQKNNERLEFLGDAVLQLTVSAYLYAQFPKLPEGELAKRRSLLVREPSLANVARELELNQFLLVGKGEKQSKAHLRNSLLCDVLEAVYGAIFLDSDFEQARQVVLRHLPKISAQEIPMVDAKSTLQEHFQAIAKKTPDYHLLREQGPDHAKRFTVEVRFEEEYLGEGIGRTKKEAEQEAARSALHKLGIQEEK